jgi:hypothetical protein
MLFGGAFILIKYPNLNLYDRQLPIFEGYESFGF